MAYTNGPKTFQVGTGGVDPDCLVKLSSGKIVANTAAATDDPIGVALGEKSADDYAAVQFLSKDGTVELKSSGAITQNADVYAAADGEIQALPSAAGTYRKIGIALEAASGDGSIIEVLPYDFHATETVSE